VSPLPVLAGRICGAMETESQRFQCYAQSEMCEVSDPEAWMEIHHGVSEDGASSDDEET
jgi:hypothetical protein